MSAPAKYRNSINNDAGAHRPAPALQRYRTVLDAWAARRAVTTERTQAAAIRCAIDELKRRAK